LAGFDATAAEYALIGVVPIKRVCRVNFVRFGFEFDFLVLNAEHLCCVVNRAISIVVVTNGAVEKVIRKDMIEGFFLSRRSPRRFCFHLHPRRHGGGAGPDQLSVNFDHAGVARLNRAELVMVTNLGNLAAPSDKNISEPLSLSRFN
jgi:hypothetical protein